MAFYVIITLTGYLSTLDQTRDLIIDRDSPFSGTDYMMIISQLAVSLSLLIGTPLNFVPVRMALFEQIFENPQYTFPRYITRLISFSAFVSSLLFASITCVLALILPGISAVLGVVGGFGCVAIAYIVPLIAFLKVSFEQRGLSYLYIIISSCLVAIGFGAAIKTFIQLIG